jgi:hypothetical protein
MNMVGGMLAWNEERLPWRARLARTRSGEGHDRMSQGNGYRLRRRELREARIRGPFAEPVGSLSIALPVIRAAPVGSTAATITSPAMQLATR